MLKLKEIITTLSKIEKTREKQKKTPFLRDFAERRFCFDVRLMSEARRELPYEGAKEMLLVEDIESRELLKQLFEAMYEELPESKKKR